MYINVYYYKYTNTLVYEIHVKCAIFAPYRSVKHETGVLTAGMLKYYFSKLMNKRFLRDIYLDIYLQFIGKMLTREIDYCSKMKNPCRSVGSFLCCRR